MPLDLVKVSSSRLEVSRNLIVHHNRIPVLSNILMERRLEKIKAKGEPLEAKRWAFLRDVDVKDL